MIDTTRDSTSTPPKSTGFLGRNTFTVFFVLACVLSLNEFLYGNAVEALPAIYQKLNLIPTTNLLQAIPILREDSSVWIAVWQSMSHPLTPTLAALIVCGLIGGWSAIKELFSRFRPWQAHVSAPKALSWYVIAIVVIEIVNLSNAGIQSLLAAPSTFSWTPGQIGWLPVAGWFVAGLFFDGGGVGEELGWRGFASAWLQKRHAPVKAAILLGLFWAAWHFPDRTLKQLFNPSDFVYWLSGLALFTLGCVTITIIMMFFSNKLGGTAIIGIVIHSLSNDSFGMKGTIDTGALLPSLAIQFISELPLLMVAIAIVVISKGTLGFDSRNPGRTIWTWPSKKTATANPVRD